VTVRKRLVFIIPLLSIFVVLSDEWIKWFILREFQGSSDKITSIFSITIHKNFGLIFDIPFRMPIILFFSAIVGAALLHLAWKQAKERPEIGSAVALIIIGALGNIYDRLVYGFTIDYLLFFKRSAINLSDLVILSGIVWLLLSARLSRFRYM